MGHRFDRVVLAARQSRRAAVAAVAIAFLDVLYGSGTDGGSAVQARKRKRKPKLVLNAFGCVDVGGRCAGNSGNCCSNVCQGAKPKRGKKDKSVCVAHNTGGCTPSGDTFCQGGPVTKCPGDGWCFLTTGIAGFCGDILQAACMTCNRDLECEQAFGPGAACVSCPSSSCTATEKRFCIGPA